MGRYSDEERQRIIAESRATLQRGAAEREEPSAVPELPPEDLLAEALARPLEDRVAKWAREADEQAARFARFARERRRQERRPEPTNWDLKIAEAIAEERRFLITVVGEAVGELRERIEGGMRKEFEEQLRQARVDTAEAKIRLAELRLSFAELREQLAADHGNKVLNLPPILRSSRAN